MGLTNRFEESVCLFHAMYGGLLYHFEANDFVIHHGKQEELHDESVLGDWQDEEDNVVFAAGSRKFEEDLAAHAEQVRSCLTTVNAWVDEDWDNDVYMPSAPLSSAAVLSAGASGWVLDPRLERSSECPPGQRNAAEEECVSAVQEATQREGVQVTTRVLELTHVDLSLIHI